MNKEHSGPSFLRFQVSQQIDVSSVVPAPANTLIRGLYPKCVCFHPSKPLMAVGVSGYLAVYDMQTNTRLGRVDLKSVPVEMEFAPDGSVIIVVVQDWILYSVSTSSWKARQAVPRRAKMDKPLESCLLAVAPGHNPFIYFCRYAKDTLRLATLPSRSGGGPVDGGGAASSGPPGAASAGSASSGRGGGWGTRVKLDVQKAILGLACHHLDMQLLVLTADGQLRGYAIMGAGGDVLSPMYAVQVQDPADKLVPAAGVLSCVPHPALPGGAIILQGSRTGTIAVLEAPGRTTPTPVLRGRLPGFSTTLGMGVCQTQNMLLAFGHSEAGRVRCTAWRLTYKPGTAGLNLRPSRVDPQDITPLLDGGRRAKAALAGAMATGALAVGSGAGNHDNGSNPHGGNGTASAKCSGLWGLTPGWALDASSSFLLEPLLGPTVGRVLVHPGLGLLAVAPDLHRALQGSSRMMAFDGRGALSGEELALARRTSTVVLMMIHNLEAPASGWRGAQAAQQHTPLTAWLPPSHRLGSPQPQQQQTGAAAGAPSSGDEEEAAAAAAPPQPATPAPGPAAAEGAALALPPHVYYLAGSRLMKYALVTRAAATLVTLPPADGPDGDVRVARQVLHSSRARAWLVFFESGVTGGGRGGTGGGAALPDRFSWTLVNAASFAAEGGGGSVMWVRSGKSGCFLGPDDALFCVMSSNGHLLEVYDTAATSSVNAGDSPLLTVTLEGAQLLPGLGAPVFPGPPMTNAPVPEARAPADAPPHDARRFRGSGVVLWQTADMSLNLTTLPALQRVPLEPLPAAPAAARTAAANDDSNSDASDAPPVYPTFPRGHHFGSLPRQAHLALLPHETVIHVAWQSLVLWPAAGSGEGPNDAVAAVLTSQRLLLVTAGLRVVCAVSLSTHGSAVMLEPLTSVVWAGPMLLASTAAGQVLQLTWTGTLLPVATMSPTGHMALLGVTADSLLVLRTPLALPLAAVSAAAAGGNAAAAAALAEVVARPAALLQPLLVGWASLAATGLLSHSSGGAAAAALVRPALRHVLASYDAASFTPRGVWALIAAGAWDVAAAVAAHIPPLDNSVRLAAAAAAGEWTEVSATLLAEASRALHAPAPSPRGSELHCKLVAAGAGALFHGQLAAATTLFQAAGEWPAAMILAVCQGNSQSLSAIAHKLAQPGAALAPSAEAQLAAQLASALHNLYGGVGTAVGDAPLTLALPGRRPGVSEPLERAERWALAAPLAAAAAVAVPLAVPHAAVPDAELGCISPFADRAAVVSYYGLTATAAGRVAAAAGVAGAAGRPPAAAATLADRGGAASAAGSSSHRPGGSTAMGDLEATSVDSADAAQAAARAEFLNQLGGGGGGGGFGRGPTIDFSSDDDDTASEATGSVADTLGGTQRRIKVQIRDPGTAATGTSTGSLREAVSNIRVAPPAGASRLAAAAGPLASPQPSVATATALASAGPSLTVQFPPGMSSAQLYAGGAALMEAGDWRGAAAHFSRAMSVLQHEERGVLDEASRRSRLSFCAQYYAAVRLLEAVGAGAGPREARLYRYLAGLSLDPKHSMALLREAITRNRTAGNYRYAADQLTALIVKVADSAPPEYLAQLQAEIEECDRHGGRNAGLSADEQVADWALLVARAGEAAEGGPGPAQGGKEEVDDLVLPLLK